MHVPQGNNSLGLGSPVFQTHPLYKLRRITLWTILPGLIVSLIALPNGGPFAWQICLYFASAVFIAYDLIQYAAAKLQYEIAAMRKTAERLQTEGYSGLNDRSFPYFRRASRGDTEDPDEPSPPRWPTRGLLVGDFVLSLFWLFTFVAMQVDLLDGGWWRAREHIVILAYIALLALALAILHACAYWKELQATMERNWRRKFFKNLRCGACGEEAEEVIAVHADENDVGNQRSWGLAGNIRNAGPSLPRWMTFGSAASKHTQTTTQPKSCARSSREKAQSSVDIEAMASSDDSSTSLLIDATPGASSSAPTLKKYGTLHGSLTNLNSQAETLVRKKSSKRLVGVVDGKRDAKLNGKGKEKMVAEDLTLPSE